jgi:exodeoxyribonuclease-3
MERLGRYLAAHGKPDDAMALLGDFNVAPEDEDVARPEAWADSVLCHPEARAALARIRDLGFRDAVRACVSGPGPFTWWDYRNLGFPKNDGLRIDHVYLTGPVVGRAVRAFVDRDERKGAQPSDHAPVVVELSPC